MTLRLHCTSVPHRGFVLTFSEGDFVVLGGCTIKLGLTSKSGSGAIWARTAPRAGYDFGSSTWSGDSFVGLESRSWINDFANASSVIFAMFLGGFGSLCLVLRLVLEWQYGESWFPPKSGDVLAQYVVFLATL